MCNNSLNLLFSRFLFSRLCAFYLCNLQKRVIEDNNCIPSSLLLMLYLPYGRKNLEVGEDYVGVCCYSPTLLRSVQFVTETVGLFHLTQAAPHRLKSTLTK